MFAQVQQFWADVLDGPSMLFFDGKDTYSLLEAKANAIRLHEHEVTVTAFTILYVEVFSKFRRHGIWTDLIASIHEHNPWEVTAIDTVINKHLKASLIRNGWQHTGGASDKYWLPTGHCRQFEAFKKELKHGPIATYR